MHRQGRSDTEIEIYYDDDDDDFFIYPIPTEVFWRHPFPYGEFFSCFAGLDVELWCESASTRKKKTDERAPGRRGGGGQAFGISLYATYSDEESQKSAHRRGGARSKQAGCSCFFFFFFFFFFFSFPAGTRPSQEYDVFSKNGYAESHGLQTPLSLTELVRISVLDAPFYKGE